MLGETIGGQAIGAASPRRLPSEEGGARPAAVPDHASLSAPDRRVQPVTKP